MSPADLSRREPTPEVGDLMVHCAVCGHFMGWLPNPTRWQRVRLWINGGSYCSKDCWAEGVH